MDRLTERQLVDTFLKSRNEHDFRCLYRLHDKRLYRMSVHLSAGDRMSADDIMQEMWIRAIKNIGRFEWRSSLYTWLVGILINCAKEHRKIGQGNESLRLEDAMQMVDGITAEERMDLMKSIGQLSPGYRTVLLLHDLEGYTHEEIGAMMGLSEGTSKSQLHHARAVIRKLLVN